MDNMKNNKVHPSNVKMSRTKHNIGGETRSKGSRDRSQDATRTTISITTQSSKITQPTSTSVPKFYKGKRLKKKQMHKKLKQNFDFSSNTSDIYIPKLNLLGLPGAVNAMDRQTTVSSLYQQPNATLSVSSETTFVPNNFNINKEGVVSISVPIIALAIFGFLAIAVCFARTVSSKKIKNFYYVANDDVSGQDMNPYECEGNVELGPYGYDYDV